ncbi:MAG: hypothetical protein QF406_04400 [Verrucomicrobiota bacterium]|nr:hypothetical protein [Verrucomicrobiota bacterium]
MLSVLSKNKSYTSISIEKGVLETHGIKSWIWDSDGCLLYGEQGAIRCRLAVRAEDLDEATEIINSDSTKTTDINQSEESSASKTESTPYYVLTFSFGLLCTLIYFLLGGTTLELPSFIKTTITFPINLFITGEVFIFLSLGIPPAITTELVSLTNFFLAIILACIVIGNRILFYIGSIILALIALVSSPWIVKWLALGGYGLAKNPLNILILALASAPVSWGLHLLGFYKSGTGALKTYGTKFVRMVTWLAIFSLFYSAMVKPSVLSPFR